MRGNELLDKMELIDPAYIEAADAAPNKRKSVWAKWGTLAACLCLVCVLAVPAMAAFSPAFYELLYAVTPATAQFFKPVQRSCEGNVQKAPVCHGRRALKTVGITGAGRGRSCRSA